MTENINKTLPSSDNTIKLTSIVGSASSGSSSQPSFLGKKTFSEPSQESSIRSWDKATEVNINIACFRLDEGRYTHVYTLLKHPYKDFTDIYLNSNFTVDDIINVHKFYKNKINKPKWVRLLDEDPKVMEMNFQLEYQQYEFISKEVMDYMLNSHKPVLYTVADTRTLFYIHNVEPYRVVFSPSQQLAKDQFYQSDTHKLGTSDLNEINQAVSSIESKILKLISRFGLPTLMSSHVYCDLVHYFK